MLDEQQRFLHSVGLPSHFIPVNSDNRRNVGFLMAFASGSQFTISIDDDNFCTHDEDLFAEHSVVCGSSKQIIVSRETGYLNICRLLEFQNPGSVYPRGFPYFARHKDENWQTRSDTCDVHVNAGLWTLDPDIDAMTWPVAMPKAKAFQGESLVLARNTWSPVNTHNTAIRNSAIPAYYFIKMGYPVMGPAIDRYGDIFSGYFVQASWLNACGNISGTASISVA
jgi:hypothetical protein